MNPKHRHRVLVVDDSAFARKVLREILTSSDEIEVVGAARDGLDALEKIAELKPDVVTLDLVMPNLDGLGVLRALPAAGGPRVVVVSVSDANTALGVEALHLGAVDVVHKPTALATDQLLDLSGELIRKVLTAASAASVRPAAPAAILRLPLRTIGGTRAVVIGTSTGGPQALTRLVGALPADFPASIVIALHIPAGYTEALSRRLDENSAIHVLEASDGAVLRPGEAVVAPGGLHLRLQRSGSDVVTRIEREPLGATHVPSVDVLFESAAAVFGRNVLGVVLTGMGNDGLAGARAITGAGGSVLTESERSCVVYGMPRSVAEAGLSTAAAHIDEMAAAILAHL